MVPRKESESLPPKPISLKTLGDYLDLSPATISLVLNNAPGVHSIPQKTRDRVIEAAKKFDYRPSFFRAFAAQPPDLFHWAAGAGAE